MTTPAIPLWEVFIRSRNGLSHRHVGSVHAADVTLAVYDRRHTTPVKSGENQGRMIENFNTVRRLALIDQWNGAAKSWTIAADDIGATQGMAVLVQWADHGAMIGCNKLEPAYSG